MEKKTIYLCYLLVHSHKKNVVTSRHLLYVGENRERCIDALATHAYINDEQIKQLREGVDITTKGYEMNYCFEVEIEEAKLNDWV